MRGDDLSEVIASPAFASYPDDVRLLAEHLQSLASLREGCPKGGVGVLSCANAGTVIRFLTAYCAQLEGCEITLTGCDRMLHRPIGQLVDALRLLGADITYQGEEGFPPLLIRGRCLKKAPVRIDSPQSTQFISALLLIGVDAEVTPSSPCPSWMENHPVNGSKRVGSGEKGSPYIALTRSVIADFHAGRLDSLDEVERDWSSAAFWLEREALGLAKEPYLFPGLREDSLQGDRVVRELFLRIKDRSLKEWDFSACPDLYPAAAVTCHLLGLHPAFTGLESLRLKESDRLAAIESNLRKLPFTYLHIPSFTHLSAMRTYSDHRIAMAFLAADLPVDDEACISKSYPAFLDQLRLER